MPRWKGFTVFEVVPKGNGINQERAISKGYFTKEAAEQFMALAKASPDYEHKELYVREDIKGVEK